MNQSLADRRRFALHVVERLRQAGYQAYWAGGCVRDLLLGRDPKDYDVATNARPEQVREVFGRQHTRAVGAVFGVVLVVGPRGAGYVDVATFRRDVSYSQGRRPDAVAFSTAEEDVQRRDFTINGLFFDPIAEQVIDYVGGQEDLKHGVVRAIGDPQLRFEEDKLRMLRAVRFAARFEFVLEGGTAEAIRRMSPQLKVVSVERIAQEVRMMLLDRHRAAAMRLARHVGLLDELLPELHPVWAATPTDEASASEIAGAVTMSTNSPAASRKPPTWGQVLEVLANLPAELPEASFPLALAALLYPLADLLGGDQPHAAASRAADDIARRWRLSNDERALLVNLLRHRTLLRQARSAPWPRLQRVLIAPFAADLLELETAEVVATEGAESPAVDDLAWCREQLRRPRNELDPPPLITGDDLLQAGLKRGRLFQTLLEQVRDAQLEGRIDNAAQALKMALELAAGQGSRPSTEAGG